MVSTDSASAPNRFGDDPLATTVAAIVLTLLVAVFLARGLPWPETDDPAFAGTAIELARSGQLTNPFIAGFLDQLGMKHFYIQPPLQPYLFAGWIRVFGVGTASFLAFAWVSYLLGGAALWRLLRRFGFSAAAVLLLVGLYVMAMVETGLRPEPQAGALLFGGLALLDWSARLPQKILALTLLGLAPLAYPLGLGIIVPFAAALWELSRPPGTPPTRWLTVSVRVWGLALAVALPLVVLTFLAMIHFDLGGFLAGYRAHLLYRRGYIANVGGSLHYFLVIALGGGEKALTLPALALFAAATAFVLWRWRRVPTAPRVLTLACAVAALACGKLYVVTAYPWIVWLAFCALTALACALPPTRAWQRAALAGVALLAAWHHALGLLDLAQRRFPDPIAYAAVRKAAAFSSKPLLIDTSIMRYAFDYRAPADALDVSFVEPTVTPPSDRTWIVCPARFGPRRQLAMPQWNDFPRQRVGSHVFRSIPLCPDQPVIIR